MKSVSSFIGATTFETEVDCFNKPFFLRNCFNKPDYMLNLFNKFQPKKKVTAVWI